MKSENFIKKFSEALDLSDRVVRPEDKFREYEEWSSLAYLSLIALIDEEYDVIIEGKDFKTLQTVQDVIDEIDRRR